MKQTNRIYITLLTIMLVCSVAVGMILAYTGLRYSYYSEMVDRAPLVLMQDTIIAHIFFALILCIVAGIFDGILGKKLSCREQERLAVIVLWLAVIVMFAAGTFFVQMNPYYPEGDQLNTTAGAYYCKSGNYMMLQKGGYIGLYEQQKGFMFLYEILFTIFGDFCYKVAGEFHVFFAILTLLAGYGFIKIHFEKVSCRIIYSMFMAFCLPFMIYLPYIYGDVPSICFSTILFWALSAYGKKLQKRYIVISAVVAALALMCRMNTWIVLIAVSIGMILLVIQKKNYRPLIATLCILLVAAGSIKAIDVMYEYRSGYESGVGIPSILWIAMGLQETGGEAGVYNRYQQGVFEENDFDQAVSIQIGKDYIVTRLKEFKENPAMAREFFWKKMSSQWTEPLFESLISTKSVKEGSLIPDWINNLYYGELRNITWKMANYYQSLVYVAYMLCAVGSLMNTKRRNDCSTKWIPMIAIIGGFLFSLLWENQCRYCLPYYIFMLMYVPQGILQIKGFVESILNRKVKSV